MSFVRLLLLPFSLLYSWVLQTRHWLFDKGVLRSESSFGVPVLCIGNLNLGGTGKTPMTEFLVRMLSENARIGVLSRGYGRTTRGFVLCGDNCSAAAVGDEPYQVYRKFKNIVKVAVCEDRASGIRKLLERFPDLDLVILDDAFQHRRVSAQCNILLTDYKVPYYEDLLVPAGHLRDIPQAARRADFIIVTKSPAKPAQEHIAKTEQLTKHRLGKDLFYSRIDYRGIFSRADGTSIDPAKYSRIILITGIARPAPLAEHLSKSFTISRHLRYPDHYHYTAASLQKIQEIFNNFGAPDTALVTTEKDFTKIEPFLRSGLKDLPWYVAEIEFDLLGQELSFKEELLKKLNRNEQHIR